MSSLVIGAAYGNKGQNDLLTTAGGCGNNNGGEVGMKAKTAAVFVVALMIVIFTSYSGPALYSEGNSGGDKTVPSASEQGLILGETVFYQEEGVGEDIPNIEVLHNGERIQICTDFPSRPRIAPDGMRMAYISPSGWEQVGSVFLYDTELERAEEFIEPADLPEQFTPKQVEWIDNERLLIIVGYAYGTVSVGGDVYLWEAEKLRKLYSPGERSEVKDIELEADTITLSVAEFDAEYLDYSVAKEEFDLNEFIR